MQREVLGAFHHGAVERLLVELGAEGDGDQSLGLTTSEHGRAVGLGQHVDFGPDGAHLVGLTAIEADALVEDGVAHSRAFHVVEVTLGERFHGLQFLFGVFFEVFVQNAAEGLFAQVLVGAAGEGEVVARLVAVGFDFGAEVFVVHFVAVFAFGLVDLFHQFKLGLALYLDGFVGGFQCAEHFLLAHFLAFAFHHADVFHRGGHHQFEAGVFHLCKGRVDDVFVADEGHAHFRDGAVERYVAHADGSRGGQGGEGVRGCFLVVRKKVDLDDGLCVVVVGEQRAQGAVDEARDEHLVVGGLGFALEETARELARGIVFLPIVD